MLTNDVIKKSISNAPDIIPLKKLIEKAAGEIAKSLPRGMSPDRMVTIATTCVSQNPELLKCTQESFIGSLLVSAQMGLEPIAGRCYLLPFNNKKKIIVNGKDEWKTEKTCQLVIGYRGLADLFYRHDAALSLDFQVVRDGDRFECQYGTNPFLNHVPKQTDKGEVAGYYAVARLRGGASIFRYMSREECLEHGKKHSKTWVGHKWVEGKKVACEPHFDEKSPWNTDPNSMCLKTVLIQLSKLLPLSVEMQRAIAVDETSRDYREGVQDAMMLPTTTQWEVEDAEKEAPKAIPGGLV